MPESRAPLDRRRESPSTRLLKAGFTAPDAALSLLHSADLDGLWGNPVVVEAFAGVADPDLALESLARIAAAARARDEDDWRALLESITSAKPLRDRLLGVLGASAALGDHLARHPADWHALVSYEVADMDPGVDEFRTVLAQAVADAGRAGTADAADALRVAYRRCLLTVAARDVCGTVDLGRVAAELADLAGATLQTALEIASAERPEDAAACRLAIIGMGKCGGRELNYLSDVDVIFVAEATGHHDGAEAAAVTAATRLAAHTMRLCSDTTTEGSIWAVDANLRPEGRNGPLVRSLASHLAYYHRWAKTWEFQALLKARPVAGDTDLGARWLAGVDELVWHPERREGGAPGSGWVADVQAMRRRVIDSIPPDRVDRELKLGPGGLRDVEFAVQLLQLVHGRSDATLRSGNTLRALAALASGGYVGRADAVALDDAYRFLRTVEHHIQLHRLHRTHLMPEATEDLRRLGRSLGYRTEPVDTLAKEWRRHAGAVRRLHEKLFYRPLLDAVARLAPGEVGLSDDAARARLEALGYQDPAAALRHISALASGVSRKAAIQRTLLPVMLGWFADSADPDSGLLAFRRVSDALGDSPWYLRRLRDEGATAENLARTVASGRLAPDLLLRAPEAVAMLGDAEGLTPRRREVLEQEITAAVRRAASPEQAVAAARGVRRRELFRTAAGEALADPVPLGTWPVGDSGSGGGSGGAGPLRAHPVDTVGTAITDITAATLTGALRAAIDAEEAATGAPLPTTIAGIALGRFGGGEMSYGSDADVVWVHQPKDGVPEPDATKAAARVTGEVRRLLRHPGTDPVLEIDTDLRPEGRQGPPVRTLESYRAYYRRWSLGWESQALLRATPALGDADLGRRFVAMIDPLRYPADGLDEAQVREIRRLKARMESERLPRGADPTTHTKLGRGGLSDVEWVVQLLQLRHAHAVPGLRTNGTRAALAAAARAGLLETEDAEVLDAAWVAATQVRNAVMLVRGRPSDTFPSDTRELGGVARLLGYGGGQSGDVIEDYRRLTRHARAVVERTFYED